jgi:hypothetical protein
MIRIIIDCGFSECFPHIGLIGKDFKSNSFHRSSREMPVFSDLMQVIIPIPENQYIWEKIIWKQKLYALHALLQ